MRTLKELDDLLNQMYDHEIKEKVLKTQAAAEAELAEGLRRQILEELQAQGLSSFKGSSGTASIGTRFAVKMPGGDAKDELRSYLTAREHFDGLWTINYATLNSYFKAEMESAKEEGTYLDIPGLEPKSDTYLSFRKNASK